jgi:ParB-like chromosome segregation protein Spo0J
LLGIELDDNDRTKFEPLAELTELAQPITVRPLGGNRHQIVAGERRWRGAPALF